MNRIRTCVFISSLLLIGLIQGMETLHMPPPSKLYIRDLSARTSIVEIEKLAPAINTQTIKELLDFRKESVPRCGIFRQLWGRLRVAIGQQHGVHCYKLPLEVLAVLHGNYPMFEEYYSRRMSMSNNSDLIFLLMFYNELALLGFEYPLKRLLEAQREALETSAYGIAEILVQHSVLDEFDQKVKAYWYKGTARPYMTSLLADFEFSEEGIKTIANVVLQNYQNSQLRHTPASVDASARATEAVLAARTSDTVRLIKNRLEERGLEGLERATPNLRNIIYVLASPVLISQLDDLHTGRLAREQEQRSEHEVLRQRFRVLINQLISGQQVITTEPTTVGDERLLTNLDEFRLTAQHTHGLMMMILHR